MEIRILEARVYIYVISGRTPEVTHNDSGTWGNPWPWGQPFANGYSSSRFIRPKNARVSQLRCSPKTGRMNRLLFRGLYRDAPARMFSSKAPEITHHPSPVSADLKDDDLRVCTAAESQATQAIFGKPSCVKDADPRGMANHPWLRT